MKQLTEQQPVTAADVDRLIHEMDTLLEGGTPDDYDRSEETTDQRVTG